MIILYALLVKQCCGQMSNKTNEVLEQNQPAPPPPELVYEYQGRFISNR